MTARILPFPSAKDAREEPLSDEALLAACAVREQKALAVLFQRHHAALYRFLSRFLGHRDPDLDDLVQSTFVEAWVHAARYRPRSSVRAWLFGIAANLARHHKRSFARRRNALTLLSKAPPRSPSSPDERASRRQMIERVELALDELPYGQRLAYVMCDLEGVKGTEAARVLGVRPGTIWRRLHEARKFIRARILEGETS